MDTIPDRPRLASPYRTVLATIERRLPLPDINPSIYSVATLLLSVGYLYAGTTGQKVLIIAIVLLADWWDGATARRYQQPGRSGYVADIIIDRASEAFIFLSEADNVIGRWFFLLWLLNTSLTYVSVRTGKHLSMPLRFAFLTVLVLFWLY